MKLYQFLFVIAFLHASLAASVHKEVKDQEQRVFTSELVDAFEITLPKSLLHLEHQNDDDSDLKEGNDVKISPSIYADEPNKLKSDLLKTGIFHGEEQVPVAIVSDPVDVIVTKQVQENVKSVDVIENPASDLSDENKKDQISNELPPRKEENNVPLKDKKPPKSSEVESNKKPVGSEKEKPAKEVKKPNENKAETPVKDKDAPDTPKDSPPLTSDQIKQSEVAEESPSDTPVNPIQQGITNFQMGIQNFVSLFRPPTTDTSPPPNIFQNIQQTLQNIVRPPTPVAVDDATAPAPGIVQQGIQGFQQTIQAGIDNLTQTFQNFINRPASDSTVESDAPVASPTILQQAVTNLQQGVQQGLSNLNLTIQGIFRPQTRPALIQTGLTNFQEGVQNISSGLQTLFATPENGSSEGNPPNLIQQSIQNLSDGLQNGVDRVNETLQTIINPVAETTSVNSTYVPIIPQGIIIIRDGIQNAINRTIAQVFQTIVSTTDASQTTTTLKPNEENEAIQNKFRQELEVLNNTLHDGIKNITEYIENITPSTEPVKITTLSTPVADENVTPKKDETKDDLKKGNAEENSVDHKVVKQD